MQRFFISDENMQGENVVLRGQQVHQIRDVLRMRPGDSIIVLDNRGWEYEVVLNSVGKSEIRGQVKAKREASGEPTAQITLHQSLLKQDKFEWILQKCTEVGVRRFVPLITQRGVIRTPDALSSKKLNRWRHIIIEAAEQSGRGLIPELAPPLDFEEAAVGLGSFDCSIIASPQTQGTGIQKALQGGDKRAPSNVALLVGSEGGFTQEEMDSARTHGAIAISLGRRILRAETAAVVAASLVLYELGEM
ncbi:MAG: 16S rRNA (uracil(1498)-N(3))-methyltransferase [Planctomycetota bacterium]|jgi:16S rRNA (uracil1498-N3)-methyltransferase